MTPSVPDYLNPIQWHQAVAVSRQECARIFRDGGAPQDALKAFDDANQDLLSGGNDGQEPTQTEYKGSGVDLTVKGLVALGEIEDIAIVAAPGKIGRAHV